MDKSAVGGALPVVGIAAGCEEAGDAIVMEDGAGDPGSRVSGGDGAVVAGGAVAVEVAVGEGRSNSVAVGAGVEVSTTAGSMLMATMVGVADVAVVLPKPVLQPPSIATNVNKLIVLRIFFISTSCSFVLFSFVPYPFCLGQAYI